MAINQYQLIIKLVKFIDIGWYQAINDQLIVTQKPFVEWYLQAKQEEPSFLILLHMIFFIVLQQFMLLFLVRSLFAKAELNSVARDFL